MSPDGSQLATGYTNFKQGTYVYKFEGRTDKNFLSYGALWDSSSGVQTRTFAFGPPSEYTWGLLDWSRDGRLWGTDISPSLFDWHSGRRIQRYGPPGAPFQSGSFNANHTLLAVSKHEGDVLIYEIPSGRLLKTFATPRAARVVWIHDNDVLALSWENEWKVGNLRQGKALLVSARTGRTLPLPPLTYLNDIRFGRDGQVILSEERSQLITKQGETHVEWERVVVWNYKNSKTLWQTSVGEMNFCRALSVSPDGNYLLESRGHRPRAGTSWTAEIVLLKTKTGDEVWSSSAPLNGPHVAWAPDSKSLAVYLDGRIYVRHVAE